MIFGLTASDLILLIAAFVIGIVVGSLAYHWLQSLKSRQSTSSKALAKEIKELDISSLPDDRDGLVAKILDLEKSNQDLIVEKYDLRQTTQELQVKSHNLEQKNQKLQNESNEWQKKFQQLTDINRELFDLKNNHTVFDSDFVNSLIMKTNELDQQNEELILKCRHILASRNQLKASLNLFKMFSNESLERLDSAKMRLTDSDKVINILVSQICEQKRLYEELVNLLVFYDKKHQALLERQEELKSKYDGILKGYGIVIAKHLQENRFWAKEIEQFRRRVF